MRRFEHEGHTILHGDVLESLATVDTDSVDLIFADPPYNIGKDFNGLRDLRDEGEYLDWCRAWIDECLRVLSPTGSFYLMSSTQMMAHLDLYCRERLEVLSRIVWTYDSSGVQARKYFGSMWEPILHMVADPRDYVFNADDIKVEAKTGAKRNLIDYRKDSAYTFPSDLRALAPRFAALVFLSRYLNSRASERSPRRAASTATNDSGSRSSNVSITAGNIFRTCSPQEKQWRLRITPHLHTEQARGNAHVSQTFPIA